MVLGALCMADRRGVFLNPFGGLPAPVSLTRSFLLAPDVFMKLAGVPWYVALKEVGAESAFKAIKYHSKKGQELPERLVNEVLRILPDREARNQLGQVYEAMTRGESRADEIAGRPGDWEWFLLGRWHGVPKEERSYSSRYLLLLSEALWEPSQLIESGGYPGAASALCCNEVTRVLVSSEMVSALATVNSRQSFGYVQWAIALEAAMSVLSAWCASMSDNDEDESITIRDLKSLITDEDGRRFGFGRSFLAFMLRVLNQTSMKRLADHLSMTGDSVEIETLKRWSAGKTLPEANRVKNIIRCCGATAEARVMAMHWVMRYLSLLGYVTERVLEAISEHSGPHGGRERFGPWPTFPFGYASFHDWAAGRLAFWHEYHIDHLAVGAMGTTAS